MTLHEPRPARTGASSVGDDSRTTGTGGLLGDTTERMYASKLELFNRFAEPEIRQLIGALDLPPGARVLDAGCGAGLASGWFSEAIGEGGLVVGCDLSAPHVQVARQHLRDRVVLVQGNIAAPSFRAESFDLVWCANTINHLADPVAGVRQLSATLRPGGRIALVQSGFLPDMFFAWDERLERAVTSAVRQFYREKYGLDEREVAGMRGLIGLAQRAGMADVTARTLVIERTAPLDDVDREYLSEAVFRGYWGERLRPYLDERDWAEVQRLTDPASPAYCLDRSDFHHLQTLTMVTGRPEAGPATQ
jgi:SAM-dependent methyltransferase